MSSEDQTPKSEDLRAELELERRRRAEVEEDLRVLRSKRPWIGRLDVWLARMGSWVTLGRDLRESLQAWDEAKSPHDPLPKPETVDLIAALLKRIIRVRWIPLLRTSERRFS